MDAERHQRSRTPVQRAVIRAPLEGMGVANLYSGRGHPGRVSRDPRFGCLPRRGQWTMSRPSERARYSPAASCTLRPEFGLRLTQKALTCGPRSLILVEVDFGDGNRVISLHERS